jgi:hypothetical protein
MFLYDETRGSRGSDTPRHKWTGVLPSSSPFATTPFGSSSRDGLSRSVLSRVPHGTFEERFLQDVYSGIMITIKHNATLSTNVGTNRQGFLDDRATLRTHLTGVLWWNCYDWNVMQSPIVFQPVGECAPTCIVDRFGKFPVVYHIANLKVFVGNQVVRRDVRVCRLAGKIFALPLHFQMLLSKSLSGLLAVRRLLLFAGESSLEVCKLLFSLAVVSGVVNGLTFGISQIRFKPNVYTHLLPRWNVFNGSHGINAQLAVVAISPSEDANPLDGLDWERFNTLVAVPNQFETAYSTPVCEDDVTAIAVKLPACGFVFHRTVVLLKTGTERAKAKAKAIALLARLLGLAVVIETRDSEPGTISSSLTSLGVETFSERVFTSKYSTIGMQVILGGTNLVHPQAQRLVADELHNTDGFINRRILLLGSTQFVLVDQHAPLLALSLFLDMLFNCSQYFPIQGTVVLFGNLSYLFQQMRREPDCERFNIVFHATIISPRWLHVNRLVPPNPTSPKGTPIHPPLKRQGLSWPFSVGL